MSWAATAVKYTNRKAANSLPINNRLQHKKSILSGTVPDSIWQPNPDTDTPNPQRLALESEADELFYGGAAGGGKSDLLLGCALSQHSKSVVFRRVYPNLVALIDRSIDIVGSDDAYNKSERTWRLPEVNLEFGHCQHESDKKKQQGRPRDFYGFDEITEFSKTQYRFIISWNRTTIPDQRCRVIVTGNPPTDEGGSWVIEEWGPWLQEEFPDSAEPGELRWYYHENDNIVWLKSGDPVEVDGEFIYPRSRTFIPARLEDNPHLSSDNQYRSVLQSLPEPLRSQLLKGDFLVGLPSNPWQVIPTEWVKLAQKRWRERERPTTPLSAVGIDPARGGNDKTAICKRYDNWFEIFSYPGIQTPDGPTVAIKANEHIESEPMYINIDVIGIGASAYDHIEPMFDIVQPINAAEGSEFRDKTGKLKARNVRAEYYWRMREALDPENGDDIALPPGNEIVADLCAATYSLSSAGITIEPKDKIKERIGRSPDLGEAILLAHDELAKDKKQLRIGGR